MCWRAAVYTEILGYRYLLSTSKALGSVRPAQSSNSSSSIKRFASFQIVLINLKLGTMSKVGCFWPWLVGGIPTPLKNMKLSWDDDIPNIWKNNVPNHQPAGCCDNKHIPRNRFGPWIWQFDGLIFVFSTRTHAPHCGMMQLQTPCRKYRN